MHKINFYKYVVNGNSFIIIDELETTQIPEENKAVLSKYICNQSTGVGCDSLIVLQNYNNKILNRIYIHNKFIYPNEINPTYIMRVYEEGLESNMCGNGLIAIGQHLLRSKSMKISLIATEIPTNIIVPRMVSSISDDTFKVTMGEVSLPSSLFFTLNSSDRVIHKTFYKLQDISLKVFIEGKSHNISFNNCFLTYTGEPHIVFFRPTLFNIREEDFQNKIFNIIFDSTMSQESLLKGGDMINQIGKQLNAMNYFPKGVNVNFSDLLSSDKIRNRCYERGINDETYACGTGAIAVAAMANYLNISHSNVIHILPWRARYDELFREASIIVERIDQTYSLTTKSLFLSHGKYFFPAINNSLKPKTKMYDRVQNEQSITT